MRPERLDAKIRSIIRKDFHSSIYEFPNPDPFLVEKSIDEMYTSDTANMIMIPDNDSGLRTTPRWF